ncbi:unnamed protein product, partial [Polarella glacialis]
AHLVKKGASLWQSVTEIPWDEVLGSGWPLFTLLGRLSSELALGRQKVVEASGLALGAWLPLAGCSGQIEGEEELDAPLAVVLSVAAQASANAQSSSFAAGAEAAAMAQGMLTAYWQS